MKGYPLQAVALWSLWIVCCPPSGGAGFCQDAPRTIEITQVDLFTLRTWDSSQVTFWDFKLGMERNEAFRNAQSRELALDDDFGQGCLKAPTCHLLQSGRYTGLSVSFGLQDSIQRIRIETPSSGGAKEDRENWIVRRLHGQTKELFENYSDSLRARLLGIANANWFDAPNASLGDQHANQEFQYFSKGLILHVESKEKRPSEMPQKTRVAVDFLFPK